LLYHRRLKSLVAIELKAGKFKPEYAGKMNFYLSVLNDKVKDKDENPSIGIIVCRGKDRTTVKYALQEVNHPIGVASYRVTPSLSKEEQKYLPSPAEIIESLGDILDTMIPKNRLHTLYPTPFCREIGGQSSHPAREKRTPAGPCRVCHGSRASPRGLPSAAISAGLGPVRAAPH
jgi:hypothetical protein